MKNITSGCMVVVQENLSKKVLFTFFAILIAISSYAQKTSSGSGDWNNAATWTPAGVPAATDNVTIAAGHDVRVNATAVCANMTITGTLRLDNNSITVGGNWTNNGTFTCVQQSNTNETVTFTGAAAIIGGTATTSFSGLTINTTGTVTLNSNAINLGTGQYYPGKLNLQSGTFDVGMGHAINLVSQNGVTMNSGGGNFKSYGPTGWTLNTAMGFSNTLDLTGRITLDNVAPLLLYGNNGYKIKNNTASSATTGLQINGLVTVTGPQSPDWTITTNAPVWGPASTLYIDRQNGQFALNQNSDLSWVAMTTGTVGVTPGYPNNVTLVNMGNSAGDGAGWYPPASTNLAINGTLRIGDATTPGVASLGRVASFTSGGIIVDNGSTLKGPPTGATFVDKGNFTLQGSSVATTGIFQDNGATINFAGTGTSAAPQNISTTGTSVQFVNVTVSNNTYVKLLDPTNVSGSLNLTGGYIGTTNTNLLSINNTSSTAVTGGSATAYVDGPMAWSIPATTSGSYKFPIGDLSHNGGAYLPLTMAPNSTSGSMVTATAFNQNSGGTPDATVTALSTTEYWSVTMSPSPSSGPLVSVSRPTAVSPYNALALSSTASGVYTAIGGTVATNSINGGGIGTNSPAYIVMVTAPLSVVKLSSKNATCTSTTGSLTVGGSGGTPPYTYSVDGSPFQASGFFSPLTAGNHTVTVKDATTTTATTTVKVLGSLIINGNDKDVIICPPATTTLTATNELNNLPTYSWSPGGATTASITVSPASTTTYTVTSTIYSDNLLPNGSFETGDLSGFTTPSYSLYTGGQYSSTPGSGGIYTISNAGTNQCQWFSTNGVANGPTLSAQDGSLYFIADGSTGSSAVLTHNLTGLTIGTVYKFSYYYAAGDPDGTTAQLRTTITNGTLVSAPSATTVSTNNVNAWSQAVYNFTASATTATITITNMTSTGATGGNDFYLDNMKFQTPCVVTASVKVIPDCSLPVELINFNAVKQGAGALLTWATANESNSSHFIIEKSSDGISFTSIGNVKAAGNTITTLHYSFSDALISSGVTYYRLAQYDLDGTVHYSVIKTVSKEGVTGVQVIPNPNNGVFVVALDNAGEAKSRVSVLNSLGQVVYENESTENLKNVDISALASGVYYLHVSNADGTVVKKIVKE